jgi:hypothetical protein
MQPNRRIAMDMAVINTDQRNGNLHINLEGMFTPGTAAQLTMVMAKSYIGKGNIFIHTKRLTDVDPNSKFAFNNLLGLTGLPKENVYLTGEKGLAISHDSAKVIVYKKKKHGHGGCGKCKNCTCQKEKAA